MSARPYPKLVRADPPAGSLSIVVPLYNEVDNVAPLLAEVAAALAQYPAPWELVLVDDGSRDGTVECVERERGKLGGRVRLVRLRRNFGQTAALQAGIDAARGELIALIDGDLQNDPADIPAMLAKLESEGLDAVCGWRRSRRDGLVLRKLPSWLANALIGGVTGVKLHDYGCTLKVFRAELLREVRLYGDMHRFIPAWLASHTQPDRIAEVVVNHRPRKHGASKYGLARIPRVLIDLLVVYFFLRFNARPGHFFGAMAFTLGGLGGLILSYLAILKIQGASIGDRPLLITGVLLVMVSVQLFTTAVVSELLARTYYESRQRLPYLLARGQQEPADDDESWRR